MPRVRHSPRNSVNDRPSPWRLLLRRQRRLLRPALWVGLASAVVLLIGIGLHTITGHAGGSLVTARERFGAVTAAFGLRVHDVIIEGRQNTPEPLLNAAIGVEKGSPILGFSLEDTRARIESIPWVESATIERRLPGTVIINLQERRPYAVWQHQGKFVLVDRAGQVVNQDTALFRHLPLIVGQGAPAAAKDLLDALRDRPALAEKVVASVRVGERRWNLHITNGTDVMLPEGHEVAALDRLIKLEQEHQVLERSLAAIDMRLPDRIVFHPRPETKDGSSLSTQPGAVPMTVPVIAKKPT
ncbi:MAG TPA: cell division protein FtsQ/DivIB [Rhodopila sp.]|nr:cell division protein FtsQ/DivIB [Rhodopila sp.]